MDIRVFFLRSSTISGCARFTNLSEQPRELLGDRSADESLLDFRNNFISAWSRNPAWVLRNENNKPLIGIPPISVVERRIPICYRLVIFPKKFFYLTIEYKSGKKFFFNRQIDNIKLNFLSDLNYNLATFWRQDFYH